MLINHKNVNKLQVIIPVNLKFKMNKMIKIWLMFQQKFTVHCDVLNPINCKGALNLKQYTTSETELCFENLNYYI